MTCLTPINQNNINCTFKSLPECPPAPKPRNHFVSTVQSTSLIASPTSAVLLTFPVAHVEQVAPELDDDLEGFFLLTPITANGHRGRMSANLTRMMPRFDFGEEESASCESSRDAINVAIRKFPAIHLKPRNFIKR
ncbi:hypothetical protein ACHAXS_004636 [Conticribra weissflogii]